MEGRRAMRFHGAGWFLSFGVFFVFISPLSGEELCTRRDELPCGNTVVQAFTTCTADSRDDRSAVCTEQHFLFVNKKTGVSVRVQGPGEPLDVRGQKIGARRGGFVTEWACFPGRREVYIGFLVSGWKLGRGDGIPCYELFDLKGRRVGSDKIPGSKEEKEFRRIWRSLGLPPQILVAWWDPIELFKTDRPDRDLWQGSAHGP